MDTLKVELFKILAKLKEDEFNNFKWFLELNDIVKGFKGIPAAQLENAKQRSTVDLIVQKYPNHGAVLVTMKILENIDRNDLVLKLQESCSVPKEILDAFTKSAKNSAPLIISPVNPQSHDSGQQNEEHERKMAELKSVQEFEKAVTLDPDTAHPNLIVSDDEKQVHHGDERRGLPNSPKRFNNCVNVLGKQSISSGKFYYEVEVKGKTAWTLGVAKESISRKGQITLCPDNGYWTIWLRNGNKYMANDENPARLSPKTPPQKVGVFVNYDDSVVCFYDVDTADLLYAFADCSFNEKLYPFFSPCTRD